MRILLGLLTLIALGAWGCAPAPPPKVQSGTIPVIRVVDGDTLHVELARGDTTIRMLHIDTPERDEPGYREATQELARLVGNQVDGIAVGPDEEDVYGRTLAYLYSKGKNINIEMVRSGWTPYYTKFGNGPFETQMRAAEAEARNAKRGLWKNPDSRN